MPVPRPGRNGQKRWRAQMHGGVSEGVCNFGSRGSKTARGRVEGDSWEILFFVNSDGHGAPLLELYRKVGAGRSAAVPVEEKLKYFDRRHFNTTALQRKVYGALPRRGLSRPTCAQRIEQRGGVRSEVHQSRSSSVPAAVQPAFFGAKSESGVAATRQGLAFSCGFLQLHVSTPMKRVEGAPKPRPAPRRRQRSRGLLTILCGRQPKRLDVNSK